MLGEAWKSFTVALGANEIKSAVMSFYTTCLLQNSNSDGLFFPEMGKKFYQFYF